MVQLRLVIFGLILALISVGCNRADPSRSELYKLLLPTDTCDFRYVCLGHSMKEIPAREAPAKPLDYSDDLSITYQFELSGGRRLLVDYYSQQLKDFTNSKGSNDALASVVAHVYLEDEVETALLYNELQARFSEQFGLPDGSYGAQIWKGSSRFTESMEARLSLGDDKKSVILNLVDTKFRNL